jgi:hypothetical protein
MAYVCKNYDEALGTFALRKPVRSTKWQPNERPLDPRPQTHHRLIEGSNSYGKYFDVKLYQTVMARFYEPKVEDGKRVERRLYMGHGSQTSQQFMYHTLSVNLGSNRLRDSEDRYSDESIIMPIYTKHFMYDEDNTMFSLDAVFVDGVLDTAQSEHTPHYRLVADKDVRQFKAKVAAHFEPYIMLAQMRMPEFKAMCDIDHRLGRRFGGEGFNRAYYMAMQELWETPEPRQQDIDVFFAMCQKAYDIIASKRGMQQPDFQVGGSWYSRQNGNKNSTVDELAKPIEMTEFRRAILDRIHKYVGSNSMKKPEEVKQFPKSSEYPRSNIQT